MALHASGASDERLLPPALEDGIRRIMGRAAGVALLLLVAFLWLSLISWAVTDPSFSRITGGPVRNWMGAPGAFLSDLVLQMLGLAAAVALLAPMFWGAELVRTEEIKSFRLKLAFYPLSMLLMAGAASAVPAGESWPLHHGLGGILGDVIQGLASMLFALINPGHAALAAGVLMLASGLSAISYSLGLGLEEFALLARREAAPKWPASAQSWHQSLLAEAQRLSAGLTGAAAGPAQSPLDPNAQDLDRAGFARFGGSVHEERKEPTLGPVPAMLEPHQEQLSFAEAPRGSPAPWSDPAASLLQAGGQPHAAGLEAPCYDEAELDPETEFPSSRIMARRFAPGGNRGPQTPDSAAPPPKSEQKAQAPKRSSLLSGLSFRRAEPQYQRPSLNLLKRPSGPKSGIELSQTALRGTARLLEDVLADFGVKGEVKDIKPGPVVTMFELEPARGTKSSRVVALADDIARSMSATGARVAVVPGRNAMGIELPNVRREPALLREILESEAFRSSSATLPIALGKSIGGEPVVADLARMPHLLIAGTTGSGKSVGVNAMILSLLYRHSPEECRFIMIDPKMLELSVYNGSPHLLAPVVTDPNKAITALSWVVSEMEERYKRMSKLAVRNIDVFNNRVRNAKKRGEVIARTVQTGYDGRTGAAIYESEALDLEPMPYIVVVVDEFADLMIVAGKEIEAAVQRLAQMARAAGIHLIMATQRPSVDIITGTIKANFPTRISFKVASKIDSRTILNEQGAEQLLGQGDMLYSSGSGQSVRVHGAFVADDEVESVAEALRQSGEARYIEDILGAGAPSDEDGGPLGGSSGDDLYDKAVAIVERDQKASVSYLQRRLSIGYNRAAGLIERMEKDGLVGPANHTGKRDILSGARRRPRDSES